MRGMYRHDYILRLIERFGATLIALRDRILRRQRDDAVWDVAAAAGPHASTRGFRSPETRDRTGRGQPSS